MNQEHPRGGQWQCEGAKEQRRSDADAWPGLGLPSEKLCGCVSSARAPPFQFWCSHIEICSCERGLPTLRAAGSGQWCKMSVGSGQIRQCSDCVYCLSVG